MSAADRSAIFRTHVERYDMEHTDLTAAQRAVIQNLIELISPDWYAMPMESPEWIPRQRRLAELGRQGTVAFGRYEFARLYMIPSADGDDWMEP
jgi:hypothetical protein